MFLNMSAARRVDRRPLSEQGEGAVGIDVFPVKLFLRHCEHDNALCECQQIPDTTGDE